jgi:hypothetical protein
MSSWDDYWRQVWVDELGKLIDVKYAISYRFGLRTCTVRSTVYPRFNGLTGGRVCQILTNVHKNGVRMKPEKKIR